MVRRTKRFLAGLAALAALAFGGAAIAQAGDSDPAETAASASEREADVDGGHEDPDGQNVEHEFEGEE